MTPPITRIDSYPIPKIDEDKINQIISDIDPDKSFSFWLETIAHQEDEQADSISDITLQAALTESFKRLAYELHHQLQNFGETISMSSLLILLSHLDGVYKEQITEDPPAFTAICDWDMQLPQTLETLLNFRSTKGDLVGEELMEEEAITSAALSEDMEATQTRIMAVLDSARENFFRNPVDQTRQEIFAMVSQGLSAQFIDLRETYRSGEQTVLKLIDEISEYLDELYEEPEDVLKNRHTIRKDIPKKYAHFAPLLELNAQEIATTFDEIWEIKVAPNLESIWSAIVEVALSELELIEKNPKAPLAKSPTKKVSPLN